MNTAAHRFLKFVFFPSMFIGVHLGLIPSSFADTASGFEKRWLSGQFFGEGANFGDFNHDGKMDVVSGPFIWDGPEFKNKHEYMEPAASDPLGYSKNFFAYAVDVNKDGWNDVVIIGFPGEEAFWYENPKDAKNNRLALARWLVHENDGDLRALRRKRRRLGRNAGVEADGRVLEPAPQRGERRGRVEYHVVPERHHPFAAERNGAERSAALTVGIGDLR